MVARGESGVRTAVKLEGLYATRADTNELEACRSRIVLSLTVAGSRGSLKVARMVVPMLAAVALTAGLMATMIGAFVSGTPVVNDQTKSLAKRFPALSATPVVPPLTVAV